MSWPSPTPRFISAISRRSRTRSRRETGFPVCTLDTSAGDVRLGAMICNDREFPESARALRLGGAEIILVPNACDMEMHRLRQVRARAWENLVGVALANYAAPQCNGHSVAFDPIAFDRHGASRDTLVIEAGGSSSRTST